MTLGSSRDPEPRGVPVVELASAIRRLDEARRELAARPDPSAACADLLAIVVEATRASRASLMLTNPRTGRLRIMAAFGLPADILGRDLEHAKRRISDWVLRERRPLLLNGEVNDQRFDGSAPADVESALCLPLLGAEGAIGVLNLARAGEGGRFGPVDLATGEHLARSLAGALDEIAERQIAEWGWRGLRTAASAVRRVAPGLFQSLRYQVALAHLESPLGGGDLSERVAHADGSQTVMTADVTGVGAEALVAAALTQGLFLALARPGRSPAEIAGQMNTELCRHLGPGRAVTMWIATLSSNGALVSCNAGFPPPFLVPMESDEVRLLEAGGPLAGVLGDAEYHEQTLRLLPGDAVVAVSDGVLRSRDATGREFGPTRVEEIAVEQRRQPLDRLAETICHEALEHGASSVPVDDLAVFAVRYSRDG